MTIGLYTLSEQIQAIGNNKWPIQSDTSDEYFKYTSLLLHGNGTNAAQNNTFIDSSANNFSISRTGSIIQGTFSPYGNIWSNYFDGTDDRLTIADNTALELDNQDFTIECWFYMSVLDTSTLSNLLIKGTGGSTLGYGIHINTSGTIAGRVTTDGVTAIAATSSNTVNTGIWYHVAFTRSGTNLTLWLNGTSVGTNTVSGSVYNGATNLNIGANDSGTNTFQGYISNLRIVKGTAIYTSTFSPTSEPLTAITNTSLLTCQNNRFIDSSSNNFSITKNGDVKISNFGPFTPASVYSTGANSGSSYYSGTSYLSIPYNVNLTLGTGDFTVEAWVNAAGGATFNENQVSIICAGQQNTSASGGGWNFHIFDSTSLMQLRLEKCLTNGTTVAHIFSDAVKMQRDTWYHVAISRSAGTVYAFINGVSIGSTTVFNGVDLPIPNNGSTFIGNGRSSSSYAWPLRGYLSQVRVVKGTALYTSAFTPPTSPLTAVTNTQLLLNFTNAAVIDNTRKNLLETAGNAQISTTQKKFGTGSLYFDGVGDTISIPYTSDGTMGGLVKPIGSTNYTIECWVYFNSTAATQVLFSGYIDTALDFMIGITSSNLLTYSLSSNGTTFDIANAVSIGTVSTSQWYHLALVKNGNTWTPYLNGVAGTSTTNSSTVISNTLSFNIGGFPNTGSYFSGYIDGIRVSKGIARYVTNFTPPVQAFQDL